MAANNHKILKTVLSTFRPVFLRKCAPRQLPGRSIFTTKPCGSSSLKDEVTEEEKSSKTLDVPRSPSLTFVNKNPRNGEYFGYNKQRGYSTQYKKRNFFKRLNLVMSNRHTKAHIEDQDGNQLVSASTEEFEIMRHLYKSNDVPAALNIGRVMAERCLQAGINRVSMYTTDIRKKEKYQEFKRALVAGGVQMTEPARVVPPQTFYTGVSVKKKRKGIIGMKTNNSTKRKFL